LTISNGDRWVELIPDSGVWLPASQPPGAVFLSPGSLGPYNFVEWLRGSGIWLPRSRVIGDWSMIPEM
jgi:hypothetical protein